MNNKNSYLAKHDSFTLAQYDFNLETQQILFAMLYKINSNYIKPFEVKNSKGETSQLEYSLDFNEIKELIGIDYALENHKEKVQRIIKDLSEKMVVFDTKEYFAVDGLIIQPVIDNITKTMTFNISTRVKPYLNEVFKVFTKFGFKHLSLCQSKYTFRLYEILITKAKKIEEDRKIIKLSIEELRDILKFPQSQGYGVFRERVLEKANIEFNALDIESLKEKEEKKLFKSFSYKPIETKMRGKGKNPITHIIFEFELLEETKILMMSKVEKIKTELNCEDWIITSLRSLIEKNQEREPYFKNLEINFIYSFTVETIENIKKEYGILGNLNQLLVSKTLENAFNRFTKNKSNKFETYLINGFKQNCDHFLSKGNSLQE